MKLTPILITAMVKVGREPILMENYTRDLKKEEVYREF